MSEIKDLVYIKRIDGRDKPVYIKCGILLTKDDGKQSVRIDAIPTGFDGWLNAYPKKENDNDAF